MAIDDYDEKVMMMMTMMMMMMSVDQTFETSAPFLNEVLLKYALREFMSIMKNNKQVCHDQQATRYWVKTT